MKKVLQKPKVNGKPIDISYPYPEMSEESQGNRAAFWTVVVSFFGHLVVIVALIFSPHLSFERSYKPSVINVRMVLPGDLVPDSGSKADVKPGDEMKSTPLIKEDLSQKEEPVADSEPKIKTEPVEIKKKVALEKKTVLSAQTEELKADVSLAPKEAPKEKSTRKIEAKTSLKKETFKPSEVVKEAIEQLEKETDGGADSVAKAIARIRSNVEGNSSAKNSSETPDVKAGRGGVGRGSGSGVGSGGGLGAGEIMDVYQGVIAHHIQGNWAFSEQLARGQSNLETLVGIKILPNGEIQDVWIDKKSGNSYLDESAIRAIKKSNPLPPLPRDTGRYYMIGLRFTPKGLDG